MYTRLIVRKVLRELTLIANGHKSNENILSVGNYRKWDIQEIKENNRPTFHL
jgi:hypothetical protein